ncbi:thrombomodulin [Ambystoma mexicanum]|uniref:thrombomodulin n=1 Tax=Ambystoma mexicanum TaxID=8296 RepID=UPI0037E83CE4
MLLLLARLSLLLLLARLALPAPTELTRGSAQCMGQSCYAFFWSPKRFQGAQRLCQSLQVGGDLMTVRSTVSTEIIDLLLKQSPGSGEQEGAGDITLWFGLQRLKTTRPCPDSSRLLRGFQWVTGDEDTDYVNWKGPHGSACDLNCAAVLSDLTWEERDCKSKSNGFLCEFTYPGTCMPPRLGPGYVATYTTPFKVEGRDFMALPPETVASITPLGLQLQCRGDDSGSMRWVSHSPGPWDCQVENGGCKSLCREESGTARCSCPQGLELAEDGLDCIPPPNPCTRHGCHQLCFTSNDNSVQCMCREGYELGEDGLSCHDIDDCEVDKNICEQRCKNTEGGFTCLCHPGYELVGHTCEDIDECEEQVCEQTCENLPGTYRCDCEPGYTPDPLKPNRCQIFCNSSRCTPECDPHVQSSCICPNGYILELDDSTPPPYSFEETSQWICVDQDECVSEVCDQVCTNTLGSFQCSCGSGYVLQEDKLSCRPAGGDEDGSSEEEATTLADTPGTQPPPPPEPLHLGVMIGITVGILSMVSILIAIASHLIRKHTVHSVTDYQCKHSEKAVVLQQVTLCPAAHQKL